jgi:hypothetical protein
MWIVNSGTGADRLDERIAVAADQRDQVMFRDRGQFNLREFE